MGYFYVKIIPYLHFNLLLFYLCRCCCCLVAKSCLTLWDLMDCSLPGSSLHGIFQARILQWVATSSFSRGSSWLRDETQVSCVSYIGRLFFFFLTTEPSELFYLCKYGTMFKLLLPMWLYVWDRFTS